MKRFSLTPIFLALFWSLSSCSDNDGPHADEFVSYDIVKLSSINNTGTIFDIYLPNSDEIITYTDTRGAVIDTTKVALGERLLLGYVPESVPYVSGNVKATGYRAIYNEALYVDTNDFFAKPLNTSEGIYLYSLWRTGPYLNVHGKVTYTKEGSTLMLSINGRDLDNKNPCPRLLLSYLMAEPVPNFQREFYASFDISELWDNPWCEGFEVELDNLNLEKSVFEFSK